MINYYNLKSFFMGVPKFFKWLVNRYPQIMHTIQ